MKGIRSRGNFCAVWAMLALSLGLATSVTAQSADTTDYGALGGLPELEAVVKQALSGEPPSDVLVEELAGGLIKIVVPAGNRVPVLRPKAAKSLINCAIYVGLSEPSFGAGILSFDAAPLAEIQYRAGWLVYNTSSQAIEADSTLKTKGPGPDLKIEQAISYRPQAFTLVFGTWVPGWEDGIHSIDVKVKGAKPGKIKNNFCAGCAF